MKLKLNKDILIVFDSEKTPYLIGPHLNNSTKINSLKALLYHYFTELKEFSVQNILEEYKKNSSTKVNAVEELVVKKEINWFRENNFLINFYHKFEKCKNLKIEYTFTNKERKEFILTADVFDSALARNWCFILSFQLSDSPNLLNNGLFYGNTFQTFEEVSKRIYNISKSCEDILKNFFEFNLESYFDQKITKESLWRLHQVFEDYYPKVLTLLEENNEAHNLESLNQLMKDLNYYIHMAEDLINEWEGGFIEVIFPKSTSPIPISSNNSHLFSTQLHEKHIYLNYFQVGYSVLAAFESGTDSKPKPQASFCANHFIYLRPNVELLKENQKEEIKNWLLEKHRLDLNDVSLRLGHVPLATLVTDKSYKELNQILKDYQTLSKISIKEY